MKCIICRRKEKDAKLCRIHLSWYMYKFGVNSVEELENDPDFQELIKFYEEKHED